MRSGLYPTEKSGPAVEKKPAAGKGKMSFKDKHALETLPKQIDDLTAKRDALSKEMADPDLYNRDQARFTRVSEAIGKLEDELAAAEERWLELEMLREELEG